MRFGLPELAWVASVAAAAAGGAAHSADVGAPWPVALLAVAAVIGYLGLRAGRARTRREDGAQD